MELMKPGDIENKIFTARDTQVMLDAHLAEMYQVETKVFNQAVKRNIDRFPDNFRFQLSEGEYEEILRSQIVTSSDHGGRRYLPYVFTEQGVAMLSAVLRSAIAVQVSIRIINTFVEMRKYLMANSGLLQRMDRFELKLCGHEQQFEKVFKALEAGPPKPAQGIFFDGQIFDAYVLVAGFIKSARSEIILIDNYVDESVLQLLSKRKKNVAATIFTQKMDKALQQDLKKHNSQYPPISLKSLKASHDRFLILDQKELYHIGASLKDLGKKWFAFSRMDSLLPLLLAQLKTIT